MNGVHINEVTWFNPKKVLPNSKRNVLVVFRHLVANGCFDYRFAQARLDKVENTMEWIVDSKVFNPNFDIVTQWAEIESKRGGCLPDPFPSETAPVEYISNKFF